MAGLWARLWIGLGRDVKLNLGVMDIGYSDAQGGAKTTGDVAQILEDKYHVMETFFYWRQAKIEQYIADAVGDQIAELFTGSMGGNSLVEAGENIQQEFRDFLDLGEMQSILQSMTASEQQYYLNSTGGFSGAGSRGVNHRKKHPYSAKNKARPAFIDTGLYQRSARAWFTKD